MKHTIICVCGDYFQSKSSKEVYCSKCKTLMEEAASKIHKVTTKKPKRIKKICPTCKKIHRLSTNLCRRCHAGWKWFEYEPKPEDFEPRKKSGGYSTKLCKICNKELSKRGFRGTCGLVCRMMMDGRDVIEVEDSTKSPNHHRRI